MFSALVFSLFFLGTGSTLPLNSPLLDSYDYIVVGGGTSGLTVANRLSEDPTVTVLVLEAGPADNGEPWIKIPFFAGEGIGSTYDWKLLTVPQTYLDGQSRAMPQGRVLGGGTILNAMLWNRGGIGDYNDWVTLGNPGWGWAELLPYFVKSETFTPHISDTISNSVGIGYNPLVHGTNGPVNVSFPSYTYNETSNLFAALNQLNIPTAPDPNDGTTAGASFIPLDLNPADQSRCDARVAYYDPYISRPNLWVSTNQHVTRVLFQGTFGNSNTSMLTPDDPSVGQGNSSTIPNGLFSSNVSGPVGSRPPTPKKGRSSTLSLLRSFRRWLSFVPRQSNSQPKTSTGSLLRAFGVEFAPNASAPRSNVTAIREVILAAGSIHTPQILKLSGVGPQNELEPLQIPILINLPGVGMNLQDHCLVGVYYPYQTPMSLTSTLVASNATLMNQYGAEYNTAKTGPWTAGPPDGDAFPALAAIVNTSNTITKNAQAQTADQYLPSNLDSSVVAGFDAQRRLLIGALQDTNRAVFELLNFNYGAFSNANMRPFSRGTVKLNSSHPFNPPLIDPRYGSNPVDLDVLLASILFNRQILATGPMQDLQPLQVSPPPDANEEAILQYIKSGIQTEFHPSGTCAMQPLDLGGVVSPELIVYGTQNLRVVDASIMPMVPASHLQAVVYGVAEKAADIIKAASNSSETNSSSILSLTSNNVAALQSTAIAPSLTSPIPLQSSYSTTVNSPSATGLTTVWVTACNNLELRSAGGA